jgi:hypothetical protein
MELPKIDEVDRALFVCLLSKWRFVMRKGHNLAIFNFR